MAEVYNRPECIFHYCPLSNVCGSNDRCVSPRKESSDANQESPAASEPERSLSSPQSLCESAGGSFYPHSISCKAYLSPEMERQKVQPGICDCGATISNLQDRLNEASERCLDFSKAKGQLAIENAKLKERNRELEETLFAAQQALLTEGIARQNLAAMLKPWDIAAGRILRGHIKPGCHCRYCKEVEAGWITLNAEAEL